MTVQSSTDFNPPDFEKKIERRGSASLKWQRYEDSDILPMWVADMDLPAPECVQRAITAAVARGPLGYGEVSQGLVKSFIVWCQHEYQWTVDPTWLVWLPGVVPGVHFAVEALLSSQAGLAVHAPVYPPLYHLGQVRQRPMQFLPWQLTGPDLLKQLAPETQALILCHPHNPSGQVYCPEQLAELAAVVKARDLLVISDEIWADLILAPACRHHPFAALNDEVAQRTVTLMAPSKTFNIAGLSCAVAVIPNPRLRTAFQRQLRGLAPDMNYLGLIAAQAAWQEGKPWLEALRLHLAAQLDRVEAWLDRHQWRELLSYQRPQATFVVWFKTERLGLNDPAQHFLNAGVALSSGAPFGDSQAVRLNVGCSTAQLEQALERMTNAIDSSALS